jgi:hypothetical protein
MPISLEAARLLDEARAIERAGFTDENRPRFDECMNRFDDLVGRAPTGDAATEIRSAVRSAGLGDAFADDLVNRGVGLHEAQSVIFTQLQRRDGPMIHNNAPYDDGGTNAPTTIQRMAEGLAARFGGPAPSEAARPYTRMRFTDMLRELHVQRGGRRDVSDHLLVRGGMHTTSDFPHLLTETGNRLLRTGYQSYQGGVVRVAKQVTARDFRPLNRLNLGEAPALLAVGEHGEVTRGTVGEAKESYSVKTYARVFSLTRQALLNDDLDAFGSFAVKQGRAAAELIASSLASLLASNPTMSDGTALFHANHGNLAASGAAIDLTTLGAGLAAMRKQTGLDGVTPIDVAPRYLIVPAAKEIVAKQFVAQITPATASNANPFAGQLEVVPDPRLDAASATAWYLAADSAVIDTIEYAFLDQAAGPQFQTREGFDILGLEMRVVLDFGAGLIDHRGLYKNPGA